MLAAGALPALGADNPRIARVGLMTDTHVQKTMASCATVRTALELFKAQGAEMVVNCGDIADQHFPDGYRCYRRTVNEVYPDAASRPKEVFVYAFHDVFNYKPGNGGNFARDAEPAFADVHALIEAPNTHTCDFVWRGLPFAVFPQSTGMKGFLSWEDYEKTVARLCAEHPGKPVFVLDHLPAAGTTFHRCPKAAFAAGAAASVSPVGKGYAISFPEAREGGDAFMYRLEAQRKSADGAWQTFSRDDIFGDFWKAAKDRTGAMAYTLSAGFFNPGESYRTSRKCRLSRVRRACCGTSSTSPCQQADSTPATSFSTT
jgi:hypothetical protein